MLSKSIDFACLRTKVEVHNKEQNIRLKYDLIEVDRDTVISSEWSPESLRAARDPMFAPLRNESGVYHDPSFIANVDKVFYLDLTLESDEEIVFPHTTLDLRLPLDNIQSLWLPGMQGPVKNARVHGLLEAYCAFTTHICNFLPVGAFYSAEGVNKLCFAFEDCKNIVNINLGAYEEEECGRIVFNLFATPSPKAKSYHVRLRLDTAFMPVFKAIENATSWLERHLDLGSQFMPVPQGAIEPVYSTWYAFLQNITDAKIEEQCEIASKLGCKTVIVDDGWQTDDNNRGYAFCGDWQVSKNRFPNMKEHVKRIHEMGMKYMVWFSVPFIGRSCQNYPEYKDVSLCYNDRWGACVLDPRYKKSRDFMVNTFANMVKEYDLDGLKLDFIDEFDMRQADEHGLAFDPDRDTQSMPDAVDMLMTEIRAALEAIKSDILIEFRQNYIGPMIRKYGNMLRAHDCPNDTHMNRKTTVDLRATSGKTAVHSDMFIWSPTESVESASLNFIHSLFAVPQVSPNFKHLDQEHQTMVAHWLKFWTEHRDLLLSGDLNAYHPEMLYPVISTYKDGEELILVSGAELVTVFTRDEVKKLTLVNGAMRPALLLKAAKGQTIKAQVKVYNCLGQEQGSFDIEIGDKVQEFELPKSGYAVLCR